MFHNLNLQVVVQHPKTLIQETNIMTTLTKWTNICIFVQQIKVLMAHRYENTFCYVILKFTFWTLSGSVLKFYGFLLGNSRDIH